MNIRLESDDATSAIVVIGQDARVLRSVVDAAPAIVPIVSCPGGGSLLLMNLAIGDEEDATTAHRRLEIVIQGFGLELWLVSRRVLCGDRAADLSGRRRLEAMFTIANKDDIYLV